MAKKKTATKQRRKARRCCTLNPKQKKFAELYCSDEKIYGNGTRCYAEAYGIDTSDEKGYNIAAEGGSRLLRNPKVLEYIGEILDISGLNDGFVDFQLLNLIKQDEDKSVKLRAITEYNSLRARIKDAQAPTTPLTELFLKGGVKV